LIGGWEEGGVEARPGEPQVLFAPQAMQLLEARQFFKPEQ